MNAQLLNPPHPVIAELAAGFLLLANAVCTYLLLAVAPSDIYEGREWALLTSLGALSAGVICFLLNTRIETRKVIIGRCLVAVVVGVVASRLTAMVHPIVLETLADPTLRFGLGAAWGFLGWVFFAPVFRRAQEREEFIARVVVQAGEARLAEKVAVLVADKAAVVAEPLAVKVEAVATALAVTQATPTLPQQVEVTLRQETTEPKPQ